MEQAKMKTFGKFFLIVGILMWVLIFVFGGAKGDMQEEYENQGFVESLGKEVSGENESTRDVITWLANVNRLLAVGGALCVVVGIAGLIVGRSKESEKE